MSIRPRSDTTVPEQIDYVIHDFVRIRVIGASAVDSAMITRHLGLPEAHLSDKPDIVLQIVERLPISSTVRHIGGDMVGFTDDAFSIRTSGQRSNARVQIAFENIGQDLEVICESGLRTVPLLMSIINLTLLGKGVLSLHASGFLLRHTGVIATGWAHASKTGLLLAAMAHGSRYVGDDWVHVSGDGSRMCGIPGHITVKEQYLRQLPHYRTPLGRGRSARLQVAGGILRLVEGRVRRNVRHRGLVAKVVHRTMGAVRNRLTVEMSPQRLFGAEACVLAGPLDKVFLLVSHEAPDVRVEPVAPQRLVQHLAFALQHERLDLLTYYLKFRFAFPALRNDLIEDAEERERVLLEQAMMGKEAYILYHPYPVHPEALFEAIRPFLHYTPTIKE